MTIKGTYCLVIYKEKTSDLKIGALGKIEFKSGYYVYIGSAMNSLIPRLKRHLSSNKKMHWHIDYLLKESMIVDIIFTESVKPIECKLANKISENDKCISSFGCSDCDCLSHLIYFTNKNNAINTIENAYTSLSIKYYDLEYFKKKYL